MMHKLEISPEVARLARVRTRLMGSKLSDELARNVVAETIYAMDSEVAPVVDEDAAYSSNDALVSAFGVNDIVLGNARVDVRSIDEEGLISINRALLNNVYMTSGTLVVRMDGAMKGSIVSFISVDDWKRLDASARTQTVVFARPDANKDFDFASMIQQLAQTDTMQVAPVAAPTANEMTAYVASQNAMPFQAQRALAISLLQHPDSWEQLNRIVAGWSKGAVRRTLEDASVWQNRVERLVALLGPRFKRVSADEVRNAIYKLGETYGGQTEAPEFRHALLSGLAKDELSRSLAGSALKKASEVADAVFSGRAAADAVKEISKNPVAVEIAGQIKKQRQRVSDFMDATAQELAGAFQQMALQPAYATHSQDPQSGVESINEALKMLEAGEFAEELKQLESEIANG